jgi:RNA polymerase sigma-70 factor (ECF subfamily)
VLLQRQLTERTPTSSVVNDGAVVAALASLGQAERELLMLIAWEGLTPAEAAVALGCSANACRIRLHRARRKLEHALDPATGPSIGNVKPQNVKPREA